MAARKKAKSYYKKQPWLRIICRRTELVKHAGYNLNPPVSRK